MSQLHPLIACELKSDGFGDPEANLIRMLTGVCEVLDSCGEVPAEVAYLSSGDLDEELAWRVDRLAQLLEHAMDLDRYGDEFIDIEELTVADLEYAARVIHRLTGRARGGVR